VTESQEPGKPEDGSEVIGGRSSDDGSDSGSPTWVSLSEAAAAVGVSSKTIRRALKAGTIRGQRSDETANSPWLVAAEDVETRWGDQAPAAASDSGVAVEDQQLDASPEPSDAAETAEVSERSITDETENPQLRGRLSELRKRLVINEPQRRWWKRTKR